MTALFVDALKGYEFFLETRGGATRGEINTHLQGIGRRSISQRTFTHYQKLMSHGFLTYLPINKFDVFQALGKLGAAADRRNYPREDTSGEVQLVAASRDPMTAEILNKSVVGFCIETQSRFPVSREAAIWVLAEGFRPIPVVVIWRQHFGLNKTRLGVRALEFISRYKLVESTDESERLNGRLKISRSKDTPIDWSELFRIHDQANQLLDASTDFVTAASKSSNEEVKPAKPKLRKIIFGSPGETQIAIDEAVAVVLKAIVEELNRYSDDFRQQNFPSSVTEKISREEISFANVRRAIQFRAELRKDMFTERIVNILSETLKELFGRQRLPQELMAKNSLEYGILQERVIPAVAELVGGDNPDFELEILD